MTTFAWHIHHDQLIEPLMEPIECRVAYIIKHKPEHQQMLRLRLLKRVRGKLPAELAEAGAAYVKARAAYFKARAARGWVARVLTRAAFRRARVNFVQAGAAYDEARAAAYPALVRLHTEECPDCPWNENTIFPP